MMLRYFIALTFLLGVPLAVSLHHYMPHDDYVLKTPVTEYELTGTKIEYRTALHAIAAYDLVKPFNNDASDVNIHVVYSPDDTAYPYFISPRGNNADADLSLIHI